MAGGGATTYARSDWRSIWESRWTSYGTGLRKRGQHESTMHGVLSPVLDCVGVYPHPARGLRLPTVSSRAKPHRKRKRRARHACASTAVQKGRKNHLRGRYILNCYFRDPSCLNGCSALIVYKCPGRKCAFFRTPAQARASLRRANARLASLDRTSQEYIAEKYYDGRMPWREGKG